MTARHVTRLTTDALAARVGCDVATYLHETQAGREWCRPGQHWVCGSRMSSCVGVCATHQQDYQRQRRERSRG
jgi:hypothetical protein